MGRYLLHILTAVLFSCATGVVHAHQPPSAPLFNPFLPANITNHTVPTLHPFNQTFRANITDLTFKYPVAAPYFRNVTAGAAWVMPSSRFDLGARGFDCECFDPSQKCCMPATNDIAPFCVPMNTTCCGNTFCTSGETCCGSSCCPASTSCWLNSSNNLAGVSGCCPKSKTCEGSSVCYDADSKDCSNTLFPKKECCPSSLPYCQDFAPFGKGCYSSSNASEAVAPMSSAIPPMFVGTGQTTTAGEMKGSATSTYTATLSFIPKSSGDYSLVGPPKSAEPTGPSITTTIVFAEPTNKTSGASPMSTTTTIPASKPTSTTTSVSSTTTVSSTSSTTAPLSTSSTSNPPSNSPLCFNTGEQHPDTCPTPTPGPSASTTNNGGFAGASTVSRSQGNTVKPPFKLPISMPSYYTLAVTILILGMIVWLERAYQDRVKRSKAGGVGAGRAYANAGTQTGGGVAGLQGVHERMKWDSRYI